ncbi:MAG: hypothetical protein LC118_16790 [Dehalococcoidia bacterium]|nr:hypothetical protein [Dehalococcoidia bacterium]
MTLTSAGGRFDAFVAKLDSQGNTLWAKSAGGTDYDEAFSLSVDAAGNIFTTGVFSDTATFGTTSLTSAGETDVFVMKMDNAGTVSWVRGYATGHDDVRVRTTWRRLLHRDMVGNEVRAFLLINATVCGPGTDLTTFVSHRPAGNVTWAQLRGARRRLLDHEDTAKRTTGNFPPDYSGLGRCCCRVFDAPIALDPW